jgi:lysine-specific demethylase/histidyl-hydroxylase NO66
MLTFPQADTQDDQRRPDILAMLFAPTSGSEFLERYFENEPLHVERNDPNYFREIYDIGEVESSMVVGAYEFDRFCLIKAGTPQVSTDEMTIERRYPRARHSGRGPRRVLDPRTVLAHFDQGYSLLIKDAALFSARLQKCVNRVQRRLGFYVQTNVYFTPPKAQGFDVHHDTHDTLIMQIEGTKTWRIYDPVVKLPVETQPFSKEVHGKHLTLNRQVTLAPGDTLYVPHGFPHEAASGEDRSLHVTLALCPVRVIDVLESMLDLAAVTDVELRRSLPPGWQTDPTFAARFATMIAERLPAAFPAAHVVPAADGVLRDLFAVTRADAGGNFDQLEHFLTPAPTCVIALRDDTPYRFRQSRTAVEVFVAGKSVAFPANCGPVLEALERGPLPLAEIDAALPATIGRQLIKALLLEGLIDVR